MKNTSAGIQKTIVKKDHPATGFAGEHALPANMQFAEEDAALKEMTDDIEGRIASGTLSRAEVRLLRNRLSAARSRFRKRHFLNILEEQVSKLETEKAALAQELEAQKQATEQAAKDAAHLRTVLASLMPEGNGSPVIADVSPVSALTAVTAYVRTPALSALPQVSAVAAPALLPSAVAPLASSSYRASAAASPLLASASARMGDDSARLVSPTFAGSPPAPAARPARAAAPAPPLAHKAPESPLLDILLSDWASASAAASDGKQEDAVLPAPVEESNSTTGWLNAYLDPAVSL